MGKKSRNAGKKSNKSHKEKSEEEIKKEAFEEFKKPFDKKAILAGQGLFLVERLLGRPFNKFNLLTIKDEGQYFSSSDNFMELGNYIHNANPEYSAEYYLWIMGNIRKCMDNTFYACINIKDKPEIVKSGGVVRGIIDMTYYFWAE